MARPFRSDKKGDPDGPQAIELTNLNMMHDNDIPESFGLYLKRERELRSIELSEIAAFTRIKLRALEAIERDDFASLPALAFVRAFIRCYADYIGLNVPDIMLRFDAFVQNRYPELTGEVPIIPKKAKPRQRYTPLILAIAAVLLIVLSYWLRSPLPGKPEPQPSEAEDSIKPATPEHDTLPSTSEELGLGNSGPPQVSSAAGSTNPPATAGQANSPNPRTAMPQTASGSTAPQGPAPEPAEDSSPEARPEEPAEPPIPRAPWTSTYEEPLGPPLELAAIPAPVTRNLEAAGPLRAAHSVIIMVKEPCWIQFSIDGEELRQLILQPEQKVTFEAGSSLKINVGNPDGVISVLHNGQTFVFKPECAPWWLNFPASPDDNVCPTKSGR